MNPFTHSSTTHFQLHTSLLDTPNKFRSLVASRKTTDTKRYDKNNLISWMQRIHKLNPSSKPNFSKNKDGVSDQSRKIQKTGIGRFTLQIDYTPNQYQAQIKQLRNVLSNLQQEEAQLSQQLQTNKQYYSQLLVRLDEQFCAIKEREYHLCQQIVDLNWTIKNKDHSFA